MNQKTFFNQFNSSERTIDMGIFNMKAKAPDAGTETCPAGTNPARLVAMIDLGTHEDDYQGKKNQSRKIFLVWELTGERMSGYKDKNHVIGKQFTLSFGAKSSLRKMVEAWRGKPFADDEQFDLSKMLGQPCLVGVNHVPSKSGDKMYAKLENVTGIPKGLTVEPAKYPVTCWDLESGNPFPALDWLPYLFGEPLKDVVARSPEWKARHGGGQSSNGHAGQGEAVPAGHAINPDAEDSPF